MFFSSWVVPQTPPSLVKFKSRACGVITGPGSSAPNRDHVPELRKADLRVSETAATADPVSWQAGAMTGVPASAFPSIASDPISVPGSTMGVNKRREAPDRPGGPWPMSE